MKEDITIIKLVTSTSRDTPYSRRKRLTGAHRQPKGHYYVR